MCSKYVSVIYHPKNIIFKTLYIFSISKETKKPCRLHNKVLCFRYLNVIFSFYSVLRSK